MKTGPTMKGHVKGKTLGAIGLKKPGNRLPKKPNSLPSGKKHEFTPGKK